MREPPKIIWLQFYGVDDREAIEAEVANVRGDDVSWCSDKIFETDVRYIIDKRYKPPKEGAKMIDLTTQCDNEECGHPLGEHAVGEGRCKVLSCTCERFLIVEGEEL